MICKGSVFAGVSVVFSVAFFLSGCDNDHSHPSGDHSPGDGATVMVPAEDHSGHHGVASSSGEDVGRVSFAASCEPEAVERVEVGLAMFHSFWFPQADGAFREALEHDPTCGMAEWGRAITRMGNPYAGSIPEARRTEALAALDRAEAAGLPTAREREWVAAFRQLFGQEGGETERERRLAWEAAMQEMAERHPDDLETRVFLGLALLAAAPPEDTTFARQLRAAEILEELFRDRPEHPGLAHYIIHAYDVPALAERGLEAALRYADIAPDAPHALHMPSHIFTRLGMWDRSVEANLRSAEASGGDWERIHAWDYLVYAYLQQGRDREAEELVRLALAAADELPSPAQAHGTFNWQAMAARLVLELESWDEAAALPLAGEGTSPAVAIRHFARGIGMARAGDLEGAAGEAGRLDTIRTGLSAAGEVYWARIVEAQMLGVEAWIHRGEGDLDTALALLDRAAALEEEVEKHPVTPGPLLPAREMHGELLLESGGPGEALASFRRVLEREPHRARTTFLAGRAALEAGQGAEARLHFAAYRELTGSGDGTRAWDRMAWEEGGQD
ncbi:MAG: hypothetical protein EA422_07765 [Gemmatimonadales bacterium]|nr:MAG: hypothetical protein EA422_07765 [Gemmatimonadales bacterium]